MKTSVLIFSLCLHTEWIAQLRSTFNKNAMTNNMVTENSLRICCSSAYPTRNTQPNY